MTERNPEFNPWATPEAEMVSDVEIDKWFMKVKDRGLFVMYEPQRIIEILAEIKNKVFYTGSNADKQKLFSALKKGDDEEFIAALRIIQDKKDQKDGKDNSGFDEDE